MNLDIDPHLIESWEDYAKACILEGQSWKLRKVLADFIWFEIQPFKREINAYVRRRQGDWMREDLDEVIKRKKPRPPNVKRKFV